MEDGKALVEGILDLKTRMFGMDIMGDGREEYSVRDALENENRDIWILCREKFLPLIQTYASDLSIHERFTLSSHPDLKKLRWLLGKTAAASLLPRLPYNILAKWAAENNPSLTDVLGAISILNPKQYPPLLCVMSCGNAKLLKSFLDLDQGQSLDLNAFYKSNKTLLMMAAQKGDTDAINVLIGTGRVDVNIADEDGETALMKAARRGHTEALKALLKAGANPNAADKKYGKTALMNAAQGGHTDAIKVLLDAGAEVDAVDEYGETALMKAAWGIREYAVKALLEAGANPNAVNKDGETALMNVVGWVQKNPKSRLRIVQALLNKGANVSHQNQNRDGDTALIKECNSSTGDLKIVQALLEAGAEVDAVNKDGETALMKAAWESNVPILQTLIAAGANIQKTDGEGQTALTLAVNKFNRVNRVDPSGEHWGYTAEFIKLEKEQDLEKAINTIVTLVQAHDSSHTVVVETITNLEGKPEIQVDIKKAEEASEKDLEAFRWDLEKQLTRT